MMAGNNAPRTFWHRAELACGTVRHRLYVNGDETPYFVDDAREAGIGHWHDGHAVSVFASGSGKEVRRRDGSTYRIAAFLAGFRNSARAKARAEQMALGAA